MADGEVESFKLIPVKNVANVIRRTHFFKPNCSLVIIHFLFRHGYFFSIASVVCFDPFDSFSLCLFHCKYLFCRKTFSKFFSVWDMKIFFWSKEKLSHFKENETSFFQKIKLFFTF